MDLIFPLDRPRPPTFDLLVNSSLIAMWGVSAAIIWKCRHDILVPKLAWVLLALIIVTGPMFILLVGGMLALPITVGLLFARRYRLLAGLVPVAGMYWIVDSVFDPSYFLPPPYGTSIETALTISFLIVPPFWVLCSRSPKSAWLGLLLPPSLTLIAVEIIRSIVYSKAVMQYTPEMWLTRVTGAAQIILVIALAALLYQMVRESDQGQLAADESIASHPANSTRLTDALHSFLRRES